MDPTATVYCVKAPRADGSAGSQTYLFDDDRTALEFVKSDWDAAGPKHRARGRPTQERLG